MTHNHMDHGHHGHHMPDMGSDATETTTMTSIQTTAATIMQAILTTVMSHHSDHRHPSSLETSHAGHTMDLDSGNVVSGATDHSAHLSPDHSNHISITGGDHMQMYFHFGVDTVILFREWTTSSTEGLIGSVIGIILLAMLYEGIKFFREYLFKKYFTSLEYSSVSVLGDDGKPVTEVHKVARNRMFSWPHLLQTFLHVVQMVLSYFLMLIFMTYNGWLCIAVVIGAGTGYFLFGWRKATVVDITEHCH